MKADSDSSSSASNAGVWKLVLKKLSRNTGIPALWQEIWLAELEEMGFYAFEMGEDHLEAYAESEVVAQKGQERIRIQGDPDWFCRLEFIPQRNWNAEWETRQEPVVLEEKKWYIRFPHHPPAPEGWKDIQLQPDLVFGTGHHPTTRLALEWMQEKDFLEKAVLDLGCGTGLLAIAACFNGAARVVAVDTDAKALTNTRANMRLNFKSAVPIALVHELKDADGPFDVILANISRNALIELSEALTRKAAPGAHLFISGFFPEDIPSLEQVYSNMGWKIKSTRKLHNWAGVEFEAVVRRL
ncbi:MAG: 50S ribosomal protein L11 methyltransferase [Flavobacteriales bacterium]|nr:50S ribosomal protein L11 methyltransferase [Flavobacteriales bacterium]MDW8432721.1 50S ribosomal protein L11 methyltransferase [Flavobacteriales bacterium]